MASRFRRLAEYFSDLFRVVGGRWPRLAVATTARLEGTLERQDRELAAARSLARDFVRKLEKEKNELAAAWARVAELEAAAAAEEVAEGLAPEQFRWLTEQVDDPQWPGGAVRRPRWELLRCPMCQGIHFSLCPAVREVEYHENGSVRRVRYWEQGAWSDDKVIWPEEVFGSSTEVDG